MKNKFLPGFLTGLVATLLVGALAVTIYFTYVDTNDKDDANKTVMDLSSVATKEDKKKANDKQEINAKIDVLEGLIDKYYLEKVDKNAYPDGMYKGLMASLGDPYSVYYTKNEYNALMESSSGVYCGIGALVTQDAKTGVITVVKPFVSGPAYKAGILPGDIIYKVDGKEVTGKDLTEVVSKMKGNEGSEVKVTIIRNNSSEPKEYTLKRKEIEVPTIEYEMLDNKIGYINVSEFDEVTADQFIKALKNLEDKGEKGLIIDLRNNPGGLLNIVTKMLKQILPKGLIVYTQDKYGEKEEFYSEGNNEFKKPLVVLINGNSASASEIFAGAVQDYGTGTLVGTTSFGKGIVQQIMRLTDGTAVKITVSKYYTPKGRNIHGTGIEPDVKIDLKEELKQKVVIEKSEDNQLQKAIELIKEKMNK